MHQEQHDRRAAEEASERALQKAAPGIIEIMHMIAEQTDVDLSTPDNIYRIRDQVNAASWLAVIQLQSQI